MQKSLVCCHLIKSNDTYTLCLQATWDKKVSYPYSEGVFLWNNVWVQDMSGHKTHLDVCTDGKAVKNGWIVNPRCNLIHALTFGPQC